MYGRHIHKDPNIDLGISVTKALNKWNTLQIFTHGPKNTKQNNYSIPMIKSAAKKVPIFSHSTYSSHPWKGKNIQHIKDQLMACKELGLSGLVIHLPKDESSVVANTMLKITDPNMLIILEMTSVIPHDTKTYESPDKIDNLCAEIDDIGNEHGKSINYGICIDTSHVWAANQDMRDYNHVKKWLKSLIYKDKIKLFHLNGTTIQLGGHKDIHSIPMSPEDVIWSNMLWDNTGIKAIKEFAKERNIPIIMEINRGDEKYVDDIHKLLYS